MLGSFFKPLWGRIGLGRFTWVISLFPYFPPQSWANMHCSLFIPKPVIESCTASLPTKTPLPLFEYCVSVTRWRGLWLSQERSTVQCSHWICCTYETG